MTAPLDDLLNLPPELDLDQRQDLDLDDGHHLSLARVVEIRSGYLFGISQVMPPNTFVTINFREMKRKGRWLPDFQRASAVEKQEAIGHCHEVIVDALRNWCIRQEIPFAAVYALENNPKGGMGPHIHILLHLPPGNYASLRNFLRNLIRKTMGWTTQALKLELSKLEAEHERLRQTGKSTASVFLPFYVTPSKDNPGGPLSSAEQIVRLAYLAKNMREQEVATIAGVARTLAEHIDHGAEITLEAGGNVRVAKRAGCLGKLTPEWRVKQGWDDDSAQDMTWLDRRIPRNDRITSVQQALKENRLRQSSGVPVQTSVSEGFVESLHIANERQRAENRALNKEIHNLLEEAGYARWSRLRGSS